MEKFGDVVIAPRVHCSLIWELSSVRLRCCEVANGQDGEGSGASLQLAGHETV